MNVPTGQAAPTSATPRRPAYLRVDPTAASSNAQDDPPPASSAIVYPLGKPAIPLPVEAFLPSRDSDANALPPQNAKTAAQKFLAALAVVSPERSADLALNLPASGAVG